MPIPFARVALAIAIVAATVACGGDDADPAAGTTPPPATDAAATDDTGTTTPDTTTPDTTTPDDHDHEHDAHAHGHEGTGRTEHDEPQPRLVMIEADTGMVRVLDVERGELVAHFESAVEGVTPGEAPATSEDGRFVFFSHRSQDRVSIVDAGTWTVAHGTHGHHHTAEPRTVGSIDGPQPSHVVSHGGTVAVFFDGDGTVTVLDEPALADGHVEVTDTFTAGGPQHGVAVPVDRCYLSSLPAADPDELPATIGLWCDGALQAELGECPDLHGEGATPDAFVFACADGLRRVAHLAGEWSVSTIAYPDVDDVDLFGAAVPRAWMAAGAPGSPYLATWAGVRHLYVYDDHDGAGRLRAVDLGEQIAVFGVAVTPHDGTGVVLTADGVLHRVDLADAGVTDQLAVVDPFDPDLTFETVQHQVVATERRAIVLDPPTNRLVEIELGDGLTAGRSFDLDGPVAQIAIAPG